MGLEYFLSQISEHPLLGQEQANYLIKRAQSGELEARNKVIVSNLGLVVSIAKIFRQKEMLGDLISVGVFGLFKAIDNFDSSSGYKFSTYATYWIWQTIGRHLGRTRIIRMPQYKKDLVSRINSIVQDHIDEKGSEPSLEYIAIMLKNPKNFAREYTPEDVSRINDESLTQQSYSLDLILEKNYFRGIKDESAKSPEFEAMLSERNSYLWKLIGKLKQMEQWTISMRYCRESYTFKEIGSFFSLTETRARQLGVAALKRMGRLITHYRMRSEMYI